MDVHPIWKGLLILYFLLAIVLATYAVYGLWDAELRPPQISPQSPSLPDKQTDAPEITVIDPKELTMGTGQAMIRIFGYNLAANSIVKFNGAQRQAQFVNAHQLVVPVNTSELAAPGPYVITVTTSDKTSEGSILTVHAKETLTGTWHFFGWVTALHAELRLLLLVLFTGAFGACIRGMTSLADYIGDGKLKNSWLPFYIVLPAKGAGIALIFYLVVRGGFVSVASNVDAAGVNPFGVTAVAALVGMFSDKATLKLAEVFSTLFKATDTRSGKLQKLAIATTKLLDAKHGQAYAQKLEVAWGTPPYKWAAVTPLPTWLTLDPDTGALSGTPPATAPATTYKFKVTDSTNTSAEADLSLTVI